MVEESMVDHTRGGIVEDRETPCLGFHVERDARGRMSIDTQLLSLEQKIDKRGIEFTSNNSMVREMRYCPRSSSDDSGDDGGIKVTAPFL